MKRLLPAHYLSVSRNSALPVAAGVSGVLANSNGKAVASCAAGERDAKSWFRGALCLLLHERLNNDFGNQELFCLPNPFLLLSRGGEWKKRKRKKNRQKIPSKLCNNNTAEISEWRKKNKETQSSNSNSAVLNITQGT